MVDHSVFLTITLIFIVSATVVFLFNKIKIPGIIGLLFSGLLLGPDGFKVIKDYDLVSTLAEIGVILLLFTIGLEFSIDRINKIKRYVFLGGVFQILLTSFLFFLFFNFALKFDFKISLFLGMTVSLSSTAMVLKFFQEKGQTYSPHGNASVGVLIFQDIAVVFMIMIVPLMVNDAVNFNIPVLMWAVIKTLFIILGVLVISKKVVPEILYVFLKLNNREVFIISTLALSFLFALIFEKLGFSLALGAFMAGVIMSESDYSHFVFDNIAPFKDVFLSLFFVSIGLLLNVNILIENIFKIILISLFIIFLKTVATYVSLICIKTPKIVSLKSALSINQVGEFSFVLLSTAYSLSLININLFQISVASIIFTLIFSSFFLQFSENISNFIVEKFNIKSHEETMDAKKRGKHVIVIGYGITGKSLGKSLRFFNIPYCVIELNPKTVKYSQIKGEDIVYGDASSFNILNEAGIFDAEIAVVAISDPAATVKIVKSIKNIKEDITVVARCRYYSEIETLKEYADYVISEEYEAMLGLIAITLNKLNISTSLIAEFLDSLKKIDYKTLGYGVSLEISNEILRKKTSINEVVVRKNDYFYEKRLRDIPLKSQFNLLIVGVKRSSEMIINPQPDFVFKENDILYIFGELGSFSNFEKSVLKTL